PVSDRSGTSPAARDPPEGYSRAAGRAGHAARAAHDTPRSVLPCRAPPPAGRTARRQYVRHRTPDHLFSCLDLPYGDRRTERQAVSRRRAHAQDQERVALINLRLRPWYKDVAIGRAHVPAV